MVKGALVQEWSNIQITEDDYDPLRRATVRLEYKDLQPEPMEPSILEVTLEVPDGKSFSAMAHSVPLAGE